MIFPPLMPLPVRRWEDELPDFAQQGGGEPGSKNNPLQPEAVASPPIGSFTAVDRATITESDAKPKESIT